MIKQTGSNTFSFPITTHPPLCRYGEMPTLDSAGATHHLTSTYDYLDHEVMKWIRDNKILYKTIKKSNNEAIVIIKDDVDAMAFILRWI